MIPTKDWEISILPACKVFLRLFLDFGGMSDEDDEKEGNLDDL